MTSLARTSRGPALSYTVLTELADAERLGPEWHGLFLASRETNAFLHPTWALAWARHFVAPGDLFIVIVRDGAELVGLAPFCRRRVGWAVGPSVTRLLPLGSGIRTELYELPGILVCTDRVRAVLRVVMTALADHSDEWDWIEIALGCNQRWIEPEWLEHDGRPPMGTLVHKETKPYVIMPLATSWPQTKSRLKRNVRESVRLGNKRVTRTGRTTEFIIADPDEVEAWVDTLAQLHSARAAMVGKVRHPDYLADRRTRAFLVEVGQSMAGEGAFVPCLLHVDGEVVAARLVLRAADRLYFSFSGFDPRWWAEYVATILMTECFRWGIDHGCTSANLSVGIDAAKLRWSEQLEFHEAFLIVGAGRRSRAAFLLYWQLRSAAVLFPETRVRAGSWLRRTDDRGERLTRDS